MLCITKVIAIISTISQSFLKETLMSTNTAHDEPHPLHRPSFNRKQLTQRYSKNYHRLLALREELLDG